MSVAAGFFSACADEARDNGKRGAEAQTGTGRAGKLKLIVADRGRCCCWDRIIGQWLEWIKILM